MCKMHFYVKTRMTREMLDEKDGVLSLKEYIAPALRQRFYSQIMYMARLEDARYAGNINDMRIHFEDEEFYMPFVVATLDCRIEVKKEKDDATS